MRNGGGRLREALASLQSQTEPRWELIAVNDGSTDNTAAILERAGQADPRVRSFTTPPHGIVHALNLGLAQCRAPLIARMDDDDLAHPTRLAQQAQFLDRQPDIGLVSSLVTFGVGYDAPNLTGNNAGAAGYRRHVDWLNSVVTPDDIRRKRFVESPVAHPSVMFRRKLLERHGDYRNGDFPEDYELWLRWLECGVRMAKVPEVLLTWNDSVGRLSRICPRYSIDAFYRLKAHYLARWFLAEVPAHRPVWIWGAGRVTRKRAGAFLAQGIALTGWIDIDARKIGQYHAGRPVCPPDTLRTTPRPFVLAYVGSWNARELIAGWLQRNGFAEEKDYLLCA